MTGRRARAARRGRLRWEAGNAPLLVVVLVFLVVGALVVLLSDVGGEAGDPASGDGTTSADEAPTEGPADEPAPEDAAADTQDTLPAPELGDEPERLAATEVAGAEAPAEPEPEAEPVGPVVRALVVDEDDEPLPDVTVVLQAVEDSGQSFPNRLADVDTDENGVAEIDLGGFELEDGVLTHPGGGWTFELLVDLPLTPPVKADLGARVEPDRLHLLVVEREALAWALPVEVQVLDAADAPVSGVRVELRRQLRNAPGRSGGGGLAHGVTDEEGVARVSRERLLEDLNGPGRFLGVAHDYRVEIDGEYPDPPWVDLPQVPDPGRLTLRLPPSGVLEIEVVDHEGVPVTSGASVSLWTRPAGSDDDVRFDRSGDHGREVVDGVATFDPVALHLELSMSVWRQGYEGLSMKDVGPTRPGETRRLKARLGPAHPALEVRLLDEQGRPLAEQRVTVEFLEWDPGPLTQHLQFRGAHLSTDAEGVLRYELTAKPELFEGRFLRVIESAPREGAPDGWVARYARVDVPGVKPEPGALVVAEDATMVPLPLLVSGVVVDEAGEPVRGARPWFRYPVGGQAEGRREQWYNLNTPIRSTGVDGTFTVHGLQRVPRLGVSASHNKLGSSEQQVVEPGTAGVRLVLVPTPERPEPGVLTGEILTDIELGFMSLEASARTTGGSRETYAFGGMFRLEMPPGTKGRFTLETQDTDWTLARVEGFEIRSGETTTLDPIDLRGRLGWLRMRVLKPNGHPVSDGWIWVGADGHKSGSVRTDANGHATALVLRDVGPYGVRGPGGSQATVAWADGEQTVHLLAAEDG